MRYDTEATPDQLLTDKPMDDGTDVTGKDPAERRKRLLALLGVAVLAVGIIWGAWYFITQRGRIHTDNAYVGAETAQVTPLIAGVVKEVRVVNTQAVRQGDVLVVLDDADARVALSSAQAALEQARQRFTQARATGSSLDAQVESRSADIAQANARMNAAQTEQERARLALSRRQALVASGAVSAEELSTARAELAGAQANLDLARQSVAAAAANRISAKAELAVNQVITSRRSLDNNPDVQAARARVDAARLALGRTIMRAPVSGIVVQRQVQVGQHLEPGAPVMNVVPVDALYVDANFKETQLRDVRVGQPAELTSDYYGGGVVFHGRVAGLAGGTGAAFALIPAQNATGNWVKVLQRLPVRIAIDPADLRKHPLRVGLSMDAVIDTRQQH